MNYYKNIDDSYTPGYTLAMGYFAPREIYEKHSLVDAFYYILHKNSIGHLLGISLHYFCPPPPPQKF